MGAVETLLRAKYQGALPEEWVKRIQNINVKLRIGIDEGDPPRTLWDLYDCYEDYCIYLVRDTIVAFI